MKGSVRIRLARFGKKRQPEFNIVVAKAKSGRDKLPIEVLGTYNPIPVSRTKEQIKAGELKIKDVKLDFTRSKYWLGCGAQPTPTVQHLFIKAGLLPSVYEPNHGPAIPKRAEIEGITKTEEAVSPDRIQ